LGEEAKLRSRVAIVVHVDILQRTPQVVR